MSETSVSPPRTLIASNSGKTGANENNFKFVETPKQYKVAVVVAGGIAHASANKTGKTAAPAFSKGC